MIIRNLSRRLPSLTNQQRGSLGSNFRQLKAQSHGTQTASTLVYKDQEGIIWGNCYIPTTFFGEEIFLTNTFPPNATDQIAQYLAPDMTYRGLKLRLTVNDRIIESSAYYVADFQTIPNAEPGVFGGDPDVPFDDRDIFTNHDFELAEIPPDYFDDLLPPGISEDALMDSTVTAPSTGDIFDMGFIFLP